MIQAFGGDISKLQARNNCPRKINVSGMVKVQGKIQKQTYVTTNDGLPDLVSMIQNDIKSNYSEEQAKNIMKSVMQSKNKLFKQFDKNWLIFADENGTLSYYGYLIRQKSEKVLVGIYEFKVNFTLQKDIYIKNYTSYSQSSSTFGGTSSTYICIDHQERRSRGISKEDILILCQYADLIEMQFKEIDF